MGASLDDTVITGDSGMSSPSIIRYDASGGTRTTAPGSSPEREPRSRRHAVLQLWRGVRRGGVVHVVHSGATVSPDGARAYAYSPPSDSPVVPQRIHTFHVSGAAAAEIATGTTLAWPPGGGGVNMLTSLDAGTLFTDGFNGTLVMAAP